MKNIASLHKLLCIAFICSMTFSCSVGNNPAETTPGGDNPEVPKPPTTTKYTDIYDQPRDEGQYWLPEMSVTPKQYYTCTGADFEGFGRYEITQSSPLLGLQYANMCESMTGLANRAVQQKKSDTGMWLEAKGESYRISKQALSNMKVYEAGSSDGISLAKSLTFKNLIDGYVLTDVKGNPESATVAAVASHVYNSIIVDVRDKEIYEKAGYTMKYDATKKKTVDSWREFKDKCNNKALILMPSLTNDLKEFAIANELFVINIKNNAGDNMELFKEVLAWLKPGSPVYGWEDQDEHSFVQPVTESGNFVVCNNFSMNMSLTSLNYKDRQKQLLVNVFNPKKIDFSNNKTKRFVSYYLSDGDNLQWIMNIWKQWFTNPASKPMKMSFGIPSTNLDMVAPDVYKSIIDIQDPENTLVENCGGGYIYIDDYAKLKDRPAMLASLAKKVGANMRQHRLKVLGLFTNDARSAAAKEGYKAFIENNDQLEGVIVVQYVPYNGGHGDIYWFKNSNGTEIPVITVKFTIWNFTVNDVQGQGTPAFIANRLNMTTSNFNLVDIHAWSAFQDIGASTDELMENAPNGTLSGATAAQACHRRLLKDYELVSLQELVWRVRMFHKPEQTEAILKTLE